MTNKTTDLETQTHTEIHIDTTIDNNTLNVEIPLLFFDCFPFLIFRSVRADASHPHSFVLVKFSDSFERRRCEGLKREWLSVPQHGGMRSLWNLRCGVKEFTDGGQR